MRKILWVSLVLVLVSGIILVGCSNPSPAPVQPQPTVPASTAPSVSTPKTTPSTTVKPSASATATPSAGQINLVFSSWTPQIGATTDICRSYMADVEKRTNGKVKFTFYLGGALGGPAAHYDIAATGMADISYYNFSSIRGRFPLIDTIESPFVFPTTESGCKVFQKLYKEFPEMQAPLSAVKVLAVGTVDPSFIFTTKSAGPVKTLEGLKGKKIRTSGIEADVLSALGATPIAILDMPEVYQALQKGILDGAALQFQALKSFKFYEVGHYFTYWEGSSIRVIPYGILMNADKWKTLPADIQKALLEAGVDGDTFAPKASSTVDQWSVDGKKLAEQAGWEFITLTPQEVERWRQKTLPLMSKITNDLNAKGLPGKKYVDRMVELAAEYEKSTIKK